MPSPPRSDTPIAFIIMPFSPQFDDVHVVLRDAVTATGFQCLRADDTYSATTVLNAITELIRRSRYVIADLSEKNPNVLFELGMCYAMGKSTVLLSRDPNDVPVDLRGNRLLLYDPSKAGLGRLRSRLIDFLEAEGLTLEISKLDFNRRLEFRRKWTTNDALEMTVRCPLEAGSETKREIEAAGVLRGVEGIVKPLTVEGWIETNAQYRQRTVEVDDENYFFLPKMNLGGTDHQIYFRVYDGNNALIAETKPFVVTVK